MEPSLTVGIRSTEQLLLDAQESLNSFFVQLPQYSKSLLKFTGFLRDSQVTDQECRVTTGSLSVCVRVDELASDFPYLEANKLLHKSICQNQRESTDFLELETKFDLNHPFFKQPSTYEKSEPSKIAYLAYLGARKLASGTPPSEVYNNICGFVACNLCRLEDISAGMEDQEHRHPYVWFDVASAARAVALAGYTFTFVPQPKDPFKTEKKLQSAHAKDLYSFIAGRLPKIRQQALRYLEKQTSLRPNTTEIHDGHVGYDPAGACFALLLAVLPDTAVDDAKFVMDRLSEDLPLFEGTILNCLRAMNPGGTFPYGLPFHYNPRGTGAFVTSMAALSALFRAMSLILRSARARDYPAAARDLFEQVFGKHPQLLEQLVLLPSRIAAGQREHRLEIKRIDKLIKGWGTDRAQTKDRSESWVTVDVLGCAVHLRELLHEYAHFEIGNRYGVTRAANAPQWPYMPVDGTSLVHTAAENALYDPDEGSPEGAVPFFSYNIATKAVIADRAWDNTVSSVLLFGPPGTSKTTIAQSLARALNWQYVQFSPGDFVRDGIERIEQRATEIFADLEVLRETVILFDELDSLFVTREILTPGSMINFIVPSMLPKMQSLAKRAKTNRLLVITVTNFYDRLDSALVRPGRVDWHQIVLPYCDAARKRLFSAKLTGAVANIDEVVQRTRLLVYEELVFAAREINNGREFHIDRQVTPVLYSARIPAEGDSSRRKLATRRLAIEVRGVVARLLGATIGSASELKNDLRRLLNDLEDRNDIHESKEWFIVLNKILKALE